MRKLSVNLFILLFLLLFLPPLPSWSEPERHTFGLWDYVSGALVPDNYVNPYHRVMSQGTLIVDTTVHIERARVAGEPAHWAYQLREVLSFEAPPWAREFMVLFDRDPDMHQRTFPGLYLRPDRPFVGGGWRFDGNGTTGVEPGWMGAMERHAHPQAAYRSEDNGQRAPRLYVYVGEDMDPAPAGRAWHVAMGHRSVQPHTDLEHAASFDDIKGRLRVWVRGDYSPPPLALKFLHRADEYDNRTGFFDDTPRTPNGNNPGTTYGEARRWVLYGAARELLDELGLRGHLPVVVRTSMSDLTHFGQMRGNAGGAARAVGARHLPGRLGVQSLVQSPLRSERMEILPVVLARESGTLPSLLSNGTRHPLGATSFPALSSSAEGGPFPPRAIGSPMLLEVFDDLSPQANFSWNLNRPDPTLSSSGGRGFWHEAKRQLAIALLGSERFAMGERGYITAYNPPRHVNDIPDIFNNPEEWLDPGQPVHFYGPHVVTSPYNPWRNAAEPGTRMQTWRGRMLAWAASCDEQGCWNSAKDSGGVLAWAPSLGRGPVGIARDMLKDSGLGDDFRSFQDRRLPRHWFDPTRSGHGIDMRRVEFPNGAMTHFVHFYTYNHSGEPEWFMAIGDVNDEQVFSAALEYYTYDPNRNPQQQANPARQGWITMDLDPPLDHPTCREARAYNEAISSEGIIFAVVDWELDGETGSWCMQPLRFGDLPGMANDVTGSWMAADDNDGGWGLSILHRNYGPSPILFSVIYYYDASGNPVWASGSAGAGRDLPFDSITQGVEVELIHINGFCRTCSPSSLDILPAGHLRLRIGEPDFGTNTSNWIESLHVENLGSGAGSWSRQNVGIKLLSSPNPSMDP